MPFGGNISGGAETTWNGHLFVDPVNGTSSGERNSLDKKYDTIANAYADYQEGDLIVVLPGSHTVAAQITLTGFNEVHIDFKPGAVVTANIAGSIFNSIAANLKMFIYGRGDIENTNGTLGLSGAAIVTGANLNVLGAKRIHCSSGTLFGVSNGWEIIENVDEMTADTGYVLNATANDFTTPFQGIVRNCKKIGDLAFPYGVFVQIGADDSLVFENCNFFSSGTINSYSAFVSTSNLGIPEFKGCNFINAAFRAVATNGGKFLNCHFQQNSGGFEACNALGTRKSYFQDCSFAQYGTGIGFRGNAACEFSGINRMYSDASISAAGLDSQTHLVSGTIIGNNMNTAGSPVAQTWLFQVNENSPTAGETYTIAAPDATSISYVVQVVDTRNDVINGLEAAWDAEVVSDPTGYFADFDSKTKTLGPVVWRLNCTALDANDNLDPGNGFVLSTDGSDSVATIAQSLALFAWTGNGKFIIDENLVVPNL